MSATAYSNYKLTIMIWISYRAPTFSEWSYQADRRKKSSKNRIYILCIKKTEINSRWFFPGPKCRMYAEMNFWKGSNQIKMLNNSTARTLLMLSSHALIWLISIHPISSKSRRNNINWKLEHLHRRKKNRDTLQTTEETTVRWHPKMRLRCDVYNVYLGVCNHSTQKKNRFNSHQSGCYQMLISISTLTSAVIEFSNFYLMFSQHTATSKSSDYKRFQHHSIILYNVYIYMYST